MENIKAIELLEPAFGLPAGSVLVRLNKNEMFLGKNEHVGDGYELYTSVYVSESMLKDKEFLATEFFEKEKRSAKHVIQEKEAEIADLKSHIKILEEILEQNSKSYSKILSRINEKKTEFQKKLEDLNKQMDEDVFAGESLEWADEAMTVYYNMIDLLTKIVK